MLLLGRARRRARPAPQVANGSAICFKDSFEGWEALGPNVRVATTTRNFQVGVVGQPAAPWPGAAGGHHACMHACVPLACGTQPGGLLRRGVGKASEGRLANGAAACPDGRGCCAHDVAVSDRAANGCCCL